MKRLVAPVVGAGLLLALAEAGTAEAAVLRSAGVVNDGYDERQRAPGRGGRSRPGRTQRRGGSDGRVPSRQAGTGEAMIGTTGSGVSRRHVDAFRHCAGLREHVR